MALHYLDLLLTLLRFLHFKICDSQEHPDDLEDARDTPDVDKLIRSSRIERISSITTATRTSSNLEQRGKGGGEGAINNVLDFLHQEIQLSRRDCGRLFFVRYGTRDEVASRSGTGSGTGSRHRTVHRHVV